jgi:putative endonuclease
MWCVYFLRLADGSLYCGCSNDLERRIQAHASGKGSKLVWSRRPFEVVYVDFVSPSLRAAALRRERALKDLTKAEKEKLVASWVKNVPEAKTCPTEVIKA